MVGYDGSPGAKLALEFMLKMIKPGMSRLCP